MALTQTQVSQLYVAIFGRASEGDGNQYWQSQSDMLAAASAMLDTSDAKSYFGDTLTDNQEFIKFIYLNTLGKTQTDDPDGIAYWVGRLNDGETKAQVVVKLINAAQAQENAGPAQDQFNNKVAVSDYVAGKLAACSDINAFRGFISGVTSDPASVAQAEAGVDAYDTTPPVQGEEFMLTSATDRIEGTDADDTFLAYIAQNQMAGGISNSLSSADRLDGNGGMDTLKAELVPEFVGATTRTQIDVQPRLTDIEDVQIEARDLNAAPGMTVTFDAKHVMGLNRIGSYYSDGDLVIENLTTKDNFGNARNTEAMTIRMDHTDNFDSDVDASDLLVYFDEDYLLAGFTSESMATYWLLDQQEMMDSPGSSLQLHNINVDGVRAVFSGAGFGGNVDIGHPSAKDATTHEEFVKYLNGQLGQPEDLTTGFTPQNWGWNDPNATWSDLQNSSGAREQAFYDMYAGVHTLPYLIAKGMAPASTVLRVNPSRTDSIRLPNGVVSPDFPAIELIVSDPGVKVVGNGFHQFEDILGDYSVYGRSEDFTPEDVDLPITVNIELDDVGRDGEGGNLIIGGKERDQNTTATWEGDGIQVFNVKVFGNEAESSNMGVLGTTNNTLEVINIRTAEGDVSDPASLTIRDGFGVGALGLNQNQLTLVNANEFKGDLRLGTDTAIWDLGRLEAKGGGDVEFNGVVTGIEIDQHGNVIGDLKGHYDYITADGNDTFNVQVDGDAVDTFGTGFSIDSGAGNDNINVVMNRVDDAVDGNGVSQLTMAGLRNLHIFSGEGDDYVNLDAYGNFLIRTAGGDDFVQINSLDNPDPAVAGNNGNATNGVWTFGQATGPQAFGQRVLYQAKLTVTFAGFESKQVMIHTNDNYVANQMDINEAIKKAIADDPDLSRLLMVNEPTDTTGTAAQHLVISSTVGGLNDLRVDINQPQVVTNLTNPATQVVLAPTHVNALRAGIIETTTLTSDVLETAAEIVTAMATNNFGNVPPAGRGVFNGNIAANGVVGADYQGFLPGGSSDSTTGINFSTINLGSGNNDLVVLHSNDNSANVIQVTEEFGKISVVNFHDISPNDVTANNEVGRHAIDFTSFLDNQIDPSTAPAGNTQSAVPVTVTLNTKATLAGSAPGTGVALANSVNMLDFDATVLNSISFAALNENNLVQALNGVPGTPVVGGIVNATLNAAANTANLVGRVQDHIVMVENVQNRGEYKVFYLTSTIRANGTTGGNFDTASAKMLGTMDFGNSINFRLVNDGTWYSDLAQWMQAADNGVTPEPQPGGDVTPPALVGANPGDDATDVLAGNNIVLTFNEPVQMADTTKVKLYNAADNSEVAANVTVAGKTITIDPNADLTAGKSYYVMAEAGSITDLAGNAFVGLDDNTDLNFTVETAAGTYTIESADVGTAQTAETLDAGADGFKFTDDATQLNNVIINNFTNDDVIEISNAAAGDYSYSNNGADVNIEYNNGGTMNKITLVGVVTAADLIFDEASFEDAIGFDAVTFA